MAASPVGADAYTPGGYVYRGSKPDPKGHVDLVGANEKIMEDRKKRGVDSDRIRAQLDSERGNNVFSLKPLVKSQPSESETQCH